MAVNGFITAVHYLEGIGIAWVLDSYLFLGGFFYTVLVEMRPKLN